MTYWQLLSSLSCSPRQQDVSSMATVLRDRFRAFVVVLAQSLGSLCREIGPVSVSCVCLIKQKIKDNRYLRRKNS